MKKCFLLFLFLAVTASLIFWTVFSDSESENNQATAGKNDEVLTKQTADAKIPEEVKHEATTSRQSPRHAAGELEKSRQKSSLVALNRAVMELEDRVEERRKVLATIVRTKGIIYREGESVDVNAAANDANAAQEYVDAKLEFEKDQQLLQEMKLKLMKETMIAKIAEDESKKKDSGK